ncbi:hypothetical protein SAMN02910400_02369, partial [Lachnospiraceae bacterium C10]
REMTTFLEKMRELGFTTSIEVQQNGKVILGVLSAPDLRPIDYEEMLKEFR